MPLIDAPRLEITEVGPRDGLQNQAQLVSTADKQELVRLLALAGLPSIEVTSLVSPKAVPQMADASEVFAGIATASWPKPRLSALVPNRKGLARAVAAGVSEVAVVVAVTDTMNRRNIGMSLSEARLEGIETIRDAKRNGMTCRAYVAVAFECPFEGKVSSGAVAELAAALREAKPSELVLADTIGAGSPLDVKRLLRDLGPLADAADTSFHFHDTRGLGVANAWAALELGIRRLDSSIGGLGGCPFAPGAAGNLATEDLVVLAEQCGLETGIDRAALLDALRFIEGRLGRELGGHSARWLRGATNKQPAAWVEASINPKMQSGV